MKTRYKSAIITTCGYLIGILTQIIVYPFFGIAVNLADMLTLGLIFMLVAFCSNFTCLTLIDKFEKRKEKNLEYRP